MMFQTKVKNTFLERVDMDDEFMIDMSIACKRQITGPAAFSRQWSANAKEDEREDKESSCKGSDAEEHEESACRGSSHSWATDTESEAEVGMSQGGFSFRAWQASSGELDLWQASSGELPELPCESSIKSCATKSEEANCSADADDTTLIVRNIPKVYSQQVLRDEIDEEGFAGTYDFFYLPEDRKCRTSRGFCFINFISAENVSKFRQRYEGSRMKQCVSGMSVTVSLAALQGFQANYVHYSSAEDRQSAKSRPWLATQQESNSTERPKRSHRRHRFSLIDCAKQGEQLYKANTVSAGGKWAASMPTSVVTSRRFCPYCGSAVQVQFRFCQTCGSSLGQVQY